MVRELWRRIPVVVRLLVGVWLALWLYQTVPLWVPRFVSPPGGKVPQMVNMRVTAYCHCGKCCGYTDILGVIPIRKKGDWWDWELKRVGLTASGKLAHYGTIAADPEIYPFGTVMKVPGYGYGMVLDSGGAVKGNHIDLYYPCHSWARMQGVRMLPVEVWPAD